MPWEHSRPTHVPKPVRDACLTRDGNQCTARLNDGTRCPERDPHKLQAAHITQWQPGERTTLANVRTLCHWHHNRETQQQATSARQGGRPKPSAFRSREQHPGRR